MPLRDTNRQSLLTSNLLLVLCLNLVQSSLHFCTNVDWLAQKRTSFLVGVSETGQSSVPLQPCLACNHQKHSGFAFMAPSGLLDTLRLDGFVRELSLILTSEPAFQACLSRAPPILS